MDPLLCPEIKKSDRAPAPSPGGRSWSAPDSRFERTFHLVSLCDLRPRVAIANPIQAFDLLQEGIDFSGILDPKGDLSLLLTGDLGAQSHPHKGDRLWLLTDLGSSCEFFLFLTRKDADFKGLLSLQESLPEPESWIRSRNLRPLACSS